jgi:hypothetical protein
MIAWRDHFVHNAKQQIRSARIGTTLRSSPVAIARRRGAFRPLVLRPVDFLAAATERIASIFKVIHLKRDGSLLTNT